jgi:hypothetical protein
MSILVKQDLNFLENPLWLQNPEQNKKGLVWRDKDGYIYKTVGKAPTKTDAIFLYYLLQCSQQNDWNNKLELSYYEIIKGSDLQPNSWWYNRLQDSLERWTWLKIGFKNGFYSNKKRYSTIFGVIDDFELPKIKGEKLKIRLSSKWLYQIKESEFYKLIDFEEMKKLKTPLATRLYEILGKTFKGRNEWSIDAHKLANKIPMQEQYLTHIIAKIKPAINRINKKTTLNIDLEIRKKERGKAVLVFRKTNPSIQYSPKKQEKEPKKLKKEVKKDLYRQFLKSEELNDMRYVSLFEIAKTTLPNETNKDVLNKKAFQIFCEEKQELLNF